MHDPPRPAAGLSLLASSAGYLAWLWLREGSQATVMGLTSRGLFLRPAAQRVVFLSLESYRSPLTITVQASRLPHVQVGAAVPLQAGGGLTLRFAGSAAVHCPPQSVWRPPPPAGAPLPTEEQLRVLRDALRPSAGNLPQHGFAPLLLQLLALPPASDAATLQSSAWALRQALQSHDLPAALQAARSLLGLGPGLTASGDDLLLGLLLFLQRWPPAPAPAWLPPFAQALARAAYHKTTTISANLIACAAQGQADERLLAAVDGIARGRPTPADWLPPLLGWGASSGVDALAGMALALSLAPGWSAAILAASNGQDARAP